ncbi:MAG TPA: tRNA (adenosine(37)-N6)-dimethylallyltransferase MiaA [Candidatus Paceibacterota bacterium]
MRVKLIALVGPTASGKSAFAVALAKKLNGEVISADSRQVYRGLDIGTGKITKREMRGVPHHMIDIASLNKTFTAHDFLIQGRRAARDITKRTLVPIVSGGTGFYIDTLVGRISLADVPPNKKMRARLDKKTNQQLLALLRKYAPRRAKNIDTHNKRRLVRALEIALSKKAPPSRTTHPPYNVLWIGISPSKEDLRKRIRARLMARMKLGMVAEARRLYKNGLSYQRMENLGLEYRWLAHLLQKQITRTEFDAGLSRDIYRYAKRQLTYWKRNKDIRWFAPNKTNDAVRLAKKFLAL